ncbi:RNA polymerase sigma-70 factor [Brevibacillus sp. H7]|uniref:RNA polymerase sigma-70 factor n=1 Tax=Brevibacillus sp. H7 TaxID=3349138 RepID=UPI003800F354
MTDTQELYTTYKPLLFSLAYRMLGTVMDAEDMVQETFLSLQKVPKEKIVHTKAFLCKVLTNRCIDFLKAARRQRETYVGPWLPEPLVFRTDHNGPMEQVITRDKISIAYLKLMESLSPVERAVFVLREVLDFGYKEIAEMTAKEEASCRKIFSRVKQKLDHELPDEKIDYEHHKQLLEAFLKALQTENTNSLLELLSADAVLYSDGGGRVRAAIQPIQSREKVIAFLLGIAKKAPADTRIQLATVNGEPGIVTCTGDGPYSVLSLNLRDGRIDSVYIIVNPDKLQRLPYQY